MTKDDKYLRETILAELRRRRDLLGKDVDRLGADARDGRNGPRAEREGPAAAADEPRLVGRSSQSSLPEGTTSR
jgi:hypothetical protein